MKIRPTITQPIEDGLVRQVVFCSEDQMKTIVNKYNTERELSRSELFMLGHSLGRLLEFEIEYLDSNNNIHDMDSLVNYIINPNDIEGTPIETKETVYKVEGTNFIDITPKN